MAIDNQFRIDELISKGSRAIVSKDEVTGNHTFIQGSKEVINDPYPHLKGERDGEQVGRIEKPKYNEDQLTKAVDTVVDELIGPPKKPQPDVVPRELYDDLRRLYNEALSRINELERQVSDLQAQIEQLLSQIESLQIELDAARIQQAVAENQAQQTNEQYTALLQDFSQAVIKSTKEGIERVSLKAQTEGLIAQKESLREQLRALNVIVGQLQAQVESEQQRQAAAEALEGREGTKDQKQNSGWKLPQSELKSNVGGALVIKTKNDKDVEYIIGTAINFYNFNDEESQTFNLSLDPEARKWLEVPASITLPPRQGNTAGKGYVTLKWKNKTDDTKGARDRKFPGSVIVSTSLGETHTIPAIYDREVDRRDTWGSRGSTTTVVGQEKT
jgi:outer membrane murein-binding lipoprotein Lpp